MNNTIEINVNKKLNGLAPVYEHLIRLGRPLDGGYLLPLSALEHSRRLITFGIGPDWSFEEDFLNFSDENVAISFDHTISSYDYFEDAGLSLFRNLTGRSEWRHFRSRLDRFFRWNRFKNHERFRHIKKRVSNNTLHNSIMFLEIAEMCNLNTSSNNILKCDIEGDEYRIIDDVVKYSQAFTCIIIEFHDTGVHREKFLECVNKISLSHFVCHIHPNNSGGLAEDLLPEVLEITFANKRICSYETKQRRDQSLTAFDFPCDPRAPEINLVWKK